MTKTTSNGVRTGFIIVSIVAAIITSVFLGGARIGRTEQAVAEARKENNSIAARQELQEQIIDNMRTEMAFQKGVVNTKLDNLQNSIEQIMEIISKWEPE